MTPITRSFAVCFVGAALLGPVPVLAQESPPAEDDAPTLDELLGLESDESEARSAEEARRANDDELQRRLSEVKLGDLFTQAIEKMALSARLLDVKYESGLATQRAQLEVLAKLDQLIDQAKQMSRRQSSSCSGCSSGCSQCSGGSKPKPGSKGGSQSANRSTGSQATDAPARRDGDINTFLEETGTEWGHLPARIRAMLKQGRDDYRSPLYRKLTEEYYKRLAEEK